MNGTKMILKNIIVIALIIGAVSGYGRPIRLSKAEKEKMNKLIVENAKKYKLKEFRKKILDCLNKKNKSCISNHLVDYIYFPYALNNADYAVCNKSKEVVTDWQLTEAEWTSVPDKDGATRIFNRQDYVHCLFISKKKMKKDKSCFHYEGVTPLAFFKTIFKEGEVDVRSSTTVGWYKIESSGVGYCELFYNARDKVKATWKIENCQTPCRYSAESQIKH